MIICIHNEEQEDTLIEVSNVTISAIEELVIQYKQVCEEQDIIYPCAIKGLVRLINSKGGVAKIILPDYNIKF